MKRTGSRRVRALTVIGTTLFTLAMLAVSTAFSPASSAAQPSYEYGYSPS